MCGIVGYAGKKDGISKIMTGLKSLEYRGYDSSGIAYVKNNKINIIKKEGPIRNLEEYLDYEEEAHTCISHTRWATHGKADDINAHPHRQGKITLVHNGIIENYDVLKNELIEKGYVFRSSTDSEVAAGVIDDIYNDTGNMISTLNKLKDVLKGSYAFNIINDDYPDCVFGIRCDSPLIVGLGDNENIMASDITAIMHVTRDYVVLDNYDVVMVTRDKVLYYDSNGNEITREVKTFSGNDEAISKNGYDHFMLKEINEEEDVIRRILSVYTENGKIVNMFDISKYRSIDIVACGSALFSGKLGKYFIEKYKNIPVNVYYASEYRYQTNFFDKDKLVIFISQSGETADTLACLKLAKLNNVDTLAIVNRRESSIAREAKEVIYIEAGIEVAVATTKAYLAQVIIMLLLAILGSKEEGSVISDLRLLPSVINKYINEYDYREIAKYIKDRDHVFYLGRGRDFYLAEEGSLKLKEISYIHSEAFQAGELKHGSISLIDEDFGVISVVTDKSISDKTISNLKEVSSRGAKVIAITSISYEFADYVIKIDDLGDVITPITVIPVMQMLAYNVALLKECDIDKPRNLAKSVTVE